MLSKQAKIVEVLIILFIENIIYSKLFVYSSILSEVCYVSKAPGPNADQHRCATERVEAVTGLDILYDDFHNRSMESMQASDFRKSCGQKYTCPDGLEECETRLDYDGNIISFNFDFLVSLLLIKLLSY